jgi:serine/threonine protein phosphatase 1
MGPRDDALPVWAESYARAVAGRRFAVGDVHGCSKTLRAMVENVLRLQPRDTLFLLGDYIDRGPDSKGVLDYLIDLSAKYDVRTLLGNHEEMALQAATDPAALDLWYGNWGELTVKQLGARTPAEIPRRYLDFMGKLPRLLISGNYILVHAGLDFSKPFPLQDTAPYNLIWQRSRRFEPEKLEGRTVLCGHTMTTLQEIRASLDKQLICLDNGCCAKGERGLGNLAGLNLDTRELLLQENCD